MEKELLEQNKKTREKIFNGWIEHLENNEDYELEDLECFIEDLEKNGEVEKVDILKNLII